MPLQHRGLQHGVFKQLAPLWAGIPRPERVSLDATNDSAAILRGAGYSESQIVDLLESEAAE